VRKAPVTISYHPTHRNDRNAFGQITANDLPSPRTPTGVDNGAKGSLPPPEDPGPSTRRLDHPGLGSMTGIGDNESREEHHLPQPGSSITHVMSISAPDIPVHPQADAPPTPSDQDVSRLHSHENPKDRSRTLGALSRASSLSSQDSINTEASTGEYMMPSKVFCSLTITLDDQELSVQPNPFKISWQNKEAFKILADTAEKSLKKSRGLQDIPLHLPSFYLRNGSCRIMGRKHRTPDRKLEHDLQIVEVLVIAICGFIHDHPYEPFRVLINWDYSTICVEDVPGTPYHEVIRDEIYRKMEKNYQDKLYIPRTDLIVITSPETSRRIIEHDTSLVPADRATLAAKVRSKAVMLQAVCVYAQLPMLTLQHLLAKGFDDQHRPWDNSHCPLTKWNTNFRDLLEKQASFFAYKFPAPNEDIDYDDIPPNVIVPILWLPGKKVLGEGPFSIVYKVKIDPVHHYFSEVCSQKRPRVDVDFSNTSRRRTKINYSH
jgi:hypothetical protein